MFSRASVNLSVRGRQGLKSSLKLLTRNSNRSVVISPAINDRPFQINAGVLPFGYDFVSDELRTLLESNNINVDDLERQYNNLIENDIEFNNAALPSEGSTLWGYVYANRLIRAKVELNTLTKDGYFKRNYLRAQIEELETRLSRYYSNLDYNGEYNRELLLAQSNNDNFETAKNAGITQLITTNGENGVSQYLSIFKNNSFITEYDENDKFNDYLPNNLENKMIEYFQYYYNLSSNDNSFASTYFNQLQSLEKAISTPLNAVTKELRQNFQLFMLDSFGRNDLDLVSSVLDTFNSSSSSLSTSSLTDGSVSSCLNLLDIKSGKVNNVTADILSKLFFGNSDGAKSLLNKDVNEVVPLLSSASNERITLVNRALTLESTLKQNNVSRVLLTVLLSLNRGFLGQFLTNEGENINAFTNANSEAIDNVIAKQRSFYKAQETFASALNKFVDNLVNSVAKERKADTNALNRIVRETLEGVTGNVSCVIIDGLHANASSCNSSGDVYGELESYVYANYLSLSGNSIGWYQLANGLLNPPRNGYSGLNLSNIANVLTNDSSKLSDLLFNNIGNYLQQNGLLNETDNNSINNILSTLVSNDMNTLKKAAGSFDNGRLESNNAMHSVTLNVDGSFNFDNIIDSYDPLNTYLSNYRYLSVN